MKHLFKSAVQRRFYQGRRPVRPLLGQFTRTPLELFRVNAGPVVYLREERTQSRAGRTSYDLKLGPDGLVHPNKSGMFTGPNGASLRPNGHMFQEIVANFFADDVVIYRIPKDLQLPKDLTLLHEHTDHYSVQCAQPMGLEMLNDKINNILFYQAERMTVDDFVRRFPYDPDTYNY